MARLNELEEAGGTAPPPVLLDGSLSFVYVQYSNLYLLAVTRANVNAAATLVFLHKLIEIFKHYFHEVRGGVWPELRRRRRPALAGSCCALANPAVLAGAAPSWAPPPAAGGGVAARQLCDRVRAAGRGDGLWVPAGAPPCGAAHRVPGGRACSRCRLALLSTHPAGWGTLPAVCCQRSLHCITALGSFPSTCGSACRLPTHLPCCPHAQPAPLPRHAAPHPLPRSSPRPRSWPSSSRPTRTGWRCRRGRPWR